MNIDSIQSLSDEQLLHGIEEAAAHERSATAKLIALLAEMDARRLYLKQGYSSLFTYCTRCLHLSEHAAYGRIEAARASRKFPLIAAWLADGSITLTTICLLSNHLTQENHERVLNDARHKTRREVEELVAHVRPMPDAPSTVRKLPQTVPFLTVLEESTTVAIAPLETSSPPVETSQSAPGGRRPAPPVVRALAPGRYQVQFTIGPDTHRKLRKLQDLMRHAVPNGDIAEIFDRAVSLLLRDVEHRRLAQVNRPRIVNALRSSGRHVPAAVKRAVWARDEGRCAFVGDKGRCDEQGFLEFHHVIPFADGGPTTIENMQLRCRAHNDYEARGELW